MNIDYGQMKSQTMGVLSNPTIISYSLIFCSTLILGYYTLHDSQAFKPSEESGEKPEIAEENKSSFGLPSFGGPNAEEKPEENKSSFGLPSFGGPNTEEKPENAPPSTGAAEEPIKEPEPEPKPEPEQKPLGIGGKKKSRRRNKKSAKKDNKSKKHHKL